MRRILLSIVVFTIAFSCLCQDFQTGTFEVKSSRSKYPVNNYHYILILDDDSTFQFTMKLFEFKPNCIGKWKIETGGMLILTCDEEESEKMLTSGYMVQREHELEIVSRNKIRFENNILGRKRSKGN